MLWKRRFCTRCGVELDGTTSSKSAEPAPPPQQGTETPVSAEDFFGKPSVWQKTALLHGDAPASALQSPAHGSQKRYAMPDIPAAPSEASRAIPPNTARTVHRQYMKQTEHAAPSEDLEAISHREQDAQMNPAGHADPDSLKAFAPSAPVVRMKVTDGSELDPSNLIAPQHPEVDMPDELHPIPPMQKRPPAPDDLDAVEVPDYLNPHPRQKAEYEIPKL